MTVSERAFDASRSYDLVRLVDGCYAIEDLSDNYRAHGIGYDEFTRWQSGEVGVWSFSSDETLAENAERERLYSGVEWETALMAEAPAEAPAIDPQVALDELWAALGAEANRRGWCNEYDQFAQAHNGPARPARVVGRVAYVRVPMRFEGPENETVDEAISRMWRENQSEFAQRVRDALTTTIGNIENDSPRYLRDYANVLAQQETGRTIL